MSSISDKIEQIIASTSDDRWNRWSRIFLNNANGSLGKQIERDALTKMAIENTAGSDSAVIQAIATNEVNNTTEDVSKRIKIFLLQHTSQYNPGANEEYLKGSLATSNTSSADYIARAQLYGPSYEVPEPSAQTPGYHLEKIGEDNGVDIYNLKEYGLLYGREQPLGFATSISSAACVHNGVTNQIIPYSGYFFEGGGQIPDITGLYSTRRTQYIIYTPGGGPLSENNWIIKVIETASNNYIGSNELKTYTYRNIGEPWIIKKIYIHFFKNNGSYVRRVIDRTNMVKQTNFSNLNIWYYQDYQNPRAMLNNETFAKVWNSCYGLGNNKIYGPPPAQDFSLFWNQGEPGYQANGIAYNGSNSWKGQEA